MHIRPATEADVDCILELHVRSIREICSRDYTPEQIEAWVGPKRPEHYLDSIRGKRLVVAEVDGRLAGFGDFDGTKNEIRLVYVSPDFQRQGVGRAIFLWIRDEMRARGFAKAWLDASLTSLEYYKAMGCVSGATQLHTFRPGVSIPCVRMTVQLLGGIADPATAREFPSADCAD
jgi:putative acetyltransferase